MGAGRPRWRARGEGRPPRPTSSETHQGNCPLSPAGLLSCRGPWRHARAATGAQSRGELGRRLGRITGERGEHELRDGTCSSWQEEGRCEVPRSPSWAGLGVRVSSGTSGRFGGRRASSHLRASPSKRAPAWGRQPKVKGRGGLREPCMEGVLQGQPRGTALSGTWALRGPHGASRDQKRSPRQPGSERLPHRRDGIITVSVTSDCCPLSSNSSNSLSDIRSSRGEGSGQKVEGGAVAPSPPQDPPPHPPPGVRLERVGPAREGRGWGIDLRLKF